MDPLPRSLSTVEDCDNLLASYEATGLSQHGSPVIQLKRRRNALFPITRLPRELRHRILHFVLQPYRRLGPPYYSRQQPIRPAFSYYLTLFTVRKVSHFWDQDICGTPSFWTVMSPLFSNKFRELIWQRSCDMALEAEVVIKEDRYNSLGWTEGEMAYLDRIIQRGMRDLHMRVPRGADPSLYITNIQHPRLATLYIYCDQSLEITSPIPAPHLVDLHLVHCILPLIGLTKLRSLTLDSTICPTLAQLLQTLTASPLLEELQLTSLRELPSNHRIEEAVLQGPLDMQYLTKVALERIPCRIAAGLLDRLVALPHCRLSVEVHLQAYDNAPLICQQAGRFCHSFVSASKGLRPRLDIRKDRVWFELRGGPSLHLVDFRETETWFSQGSQLIRLFLDEIDGACFKEPIDESLLWYDSIPTAFEGTRIMGDFFPNTHGLSVAILTAGLDGMTKALSETKNPEDGLPRWPLPRLSTLDLKLVTSDDEVYGNLIDMIIKRTQAAASPLSAVSPIRKLRLDGGGVQRKSLRKLDDMGIEYELRCVTVSHHPASDESSDEADIL